MPTKSTSISAFRVTGWGKQKLAAIAGKARRLGMTPQQYVKQLVDADLELDRAAQSTSLTDLAGSRTDVDDAELDRLVEEARDRHHARVSKKRA